MGAFSSLTMEDTRHLDARGHKGEVDEMAQGPCTLAFKASLSFEHGENILTAGHSHH